MKTSFEIFFYSAALSSLDLEFLFTEMSSIQRKRTSLSQKYKAIVDLESGLKPSKVAEKFNVPRNTISTWIKKKDKIKSAFKSGEVGLKRKNIRIG